MNRNWQEQITSRQIEIIRAIVSEFVASGTPVGSKNVVSKFGFDFSSATVRKEMSVLEQMGLLFSPHTSAGRLPTDLAINVYVQDLVQIYQLTLAQKSQLDEFYRTARLQLDQLLLATAQLLANTSNYLGVVTSPVATISTIRRVELISVVDSLVLAVLVTTNGAIYEKKIQLDRAVNQEDLYRISRLLNQHLPGLELSEIQQTGLNFLDSQPLGELTAVAVQVTQNLVYAPPEAEVYTDGDSRLVQQIYSLIPDKERADRLIEALANRKFLSDLIQSINRVNEIAVQVGIEIGGEMFHGISVLTRGYMVGGRSLGALGVIGMSRMPYDRLIPALDYSAEVLGNMLAETDETDVWEAGIPMPVRRRFSGTGG